MFNCFGPVLGDHWVLSDMAVKCFQGRHPAVMALSGVVCGVWATVPLSVVWMGLRRPGTHHDPRFKFLFGWSWAPQPVCMIPNEALFAFLHCFVPHTPQMDTRGSVAGGRRW